MSKKTVIYLIISVLAIGILILKYNDYKEKNLDDLFIQYSKHYKSIAFEVYDDNKSIPDDKAVMDELTGFLSQYQVKKMKDAEWNSDVSKEKGFWIDIQSKNKLITILFLEERVHIPGFGYYRVINGPIDIDWLQNFQEKHRR